MQETELSRQDPLSEICQDLIDLALLEDLGNPRRDLTTDLLFPDSSQPLAAVIQSKHPEPIVFCGAPIIEAVVKRLDPQAQLSAQPEGALVQPGDTVLHLRASAPAILKAERLCLNILRTLCATATLTRQMVDAIAHTSTKLLDTRKTLPGMRAMQRYAVRCGGGANHRMGLYDALMIKDTHIGLVGSMQKTLQKLPHNITSQYPVIVEVATYSDLEIVLSEGLGKITRILLDNMSPEALIPALDMIDGRVPTEASGNITLDTIQAIAQTGVDFVSVGSITHSCGQVDLSMQV